MYYFIPFLFVVLFPFHSWAACSGYPAGIGADVFVEALAGNPTFGKRDHMIGLHGSNGIAGMITYDPTDNKLKLCDGTNWNSLAVAGGTSLWSQSGSKVYYNGGNVGIGTTEPNNLLEIVDGNSHFTSNAGSIEIARDSASAESVGGFIDLKKDRSDDARVRIAYLDDTGIGGRGLAIYLDQDGGTWSAMNRFMILDNGNVGIGTDDPQSKLHVDGGALFGDSLVTATYISSSDGNTINGQYGNASNNVDLWLNYRGYQDGFTYDRNLKIGDGKGNVKITVVGSTGNVGIGTDDPSDTLHLASNTNNDQLLRLSGPNGNSIGFYQNTSQVHQLKSYYDTRWKFGILDPYAGGGITLSRVGGAGSGVNVGIGTTNPGSYKLNVAGSIYTSGGCAGCSDARWKKNVQPIHNALAAIDKLQGVRFDWKKDEFPDRQFPDTREIGFIAQEVEKELPELVYEDGGYKHLRYEKMTAILTEAIKELKADNDALKSVVCDLAPQHAYCQ